MKKTAILSFVLVIILLGCTQKKESGIEGAWKLVYAENPSMGWLFPTQEKGEQIKMWSAAHFTFAGQFQMDTLTQVNYGYGTYTLDGNHYEEAVQLHTNPANIGATIRMILEIKNDTLTQKYPADENWMLPEKFNTEKYVRVK